MKRFLLIIFFSCCAVAYADKPTQITFWHSMNGTLGQNMNIVIQQFNSSQSDYQIIPTYKGEYPITLEQTIAAFTGKNPPDIAQIFDVGTSEMIYTKGLILPLHQLMQENNITLDQNDFLPPIRYYYSDADGNLLALPFNISSPIVFFNKTAFIKAGLDPNKPPTTWPELADAAKKLLQVGYKCGFTSTWPTWIQLESFTAWHNLPFATEDNGFLSIDTNLLFNNPLVIQHLDALAQWQKQHIFQYAGKNEDPMVLFNSGHCAMLMGSSAVEPVLIQSSQFPVGVAPLPYWPGVKTAPQNTTIGGAAIWVLAGRPDNVNKGVAKFLQFLAQAQVQAEWAKSTGYLPTTQSAYDILQNTGYYKENPGAYVAFGELLNKPSTVYSRGFRLASYWKIREILDEELKSVILGEKSAQQAMDNAVQQGNKLLQQFQKTFFIDKHK